MSRGLDSRPHHCIVARRIFFSLAQHLGWDHPFLLPFVRLRQPTVMVVVRRKEGSFHPQIITEEDNDASEGKIEYHLEGNDHTHVTGARGGALIQFSPFDDD